MTNEKRPMLGLQGPVLAWQDPWAGDASDRIMRTGTGQVYRSQDPTPTGEAFVRAMKELGAEFYVHHLMPGLEGQAAMLRDLVRLDMKVCLGNEYGNINGPWAEGTNRYDAPDDAVLEAARTGKLIGLLYDEPEHLQINASQYRKDGWFPHWAATDGQTLEQSYGRFVHAVAERVRHVGALLRQAGLAEEAVPLVSEQVFPVLFHANARAGMAVCPKVMKESFQPLQLAAALGAAKQYGRPLWICADLWGPDVGRWFTRMSGFPGHSPEEFASALEMGYLMGPTHLFAENIDVLLRHEGEGRFASTEFGDVWRRFALDFVPRHPLDWRHDEAEADIALIHSDDSNYGQNARLFGNRTLEAPEASRSVFRAWHLLSRGAIPAHGSCMHIPGYDFPRHELKRRVPPESFPLPDGCPDLPATSTHPLFYPANNVLVFDEFVREEQLGEPKLVIAAGSRLSAETLRALRRKAEAGTAVIVSAGLVPAEWKESRRFGAGFWLTADDFLSDAVREAAEPFLGAENCWRQRFGRTEVRFTPGNEAGTTLQAEFVRG